MQHGSHTNLYVWHSWPPSWKEPYGSRWLSLLFLINRRGVGSLRPKQPFLPRAMEYQHGAVPAMHRAATAARLRHHTHLQCAASGRRRGEYSVI